MKYLISAVVLLSVWVGPVLAIRESTSRSVSPSVKISGRVVDDETGKAIEHFTLEWGWANPKDEKINWGGSTVNSARWANGKFSSQDGWQAGQKVWARIIAPGYVAQPITPQPLVVPTEAKNLVVRMKKGAKLNGVVLDYQSKPVAGANVYLVTTGLNLEDGAPDVVSGRSFSGTSTTTD